MDSLLAKAAGGAQTTPIGRSIAGPLKTTGVHKGFQKPQGRMKMLLPVFLQTSDRQGQHMRSQMGDLNAGQDEKPTVVGQVVEVEFSLWRRPPNVPIANRKLQGRGTKGQSRYRVALEKRQIL